MVRVRPPNIMATQLRNRKSREGRARIWQGSGLGYFREWRVSELMLPTRQKGQRKTRWLRERRKNPEVCSPCRGRVYLPHTHSEVFSCKDALRQGKSRRKQGVPSAKYGEALSIFLTAST
jgi:hypothetical protein